MNLEMTGRIDTSGRRPPVISNGALGMMLLIGSETILFGCFINAYLVLRMASTMWPPLNTPKLQIGLSGINTAVIVLSSIIAALAGWREKQNASKSARALIDTTIGMGTLFFILQVVEFYQLYAKGLTLKTGPYGAVFYTLIGCHALHVLGGLFFLALSVKLKTWAPHARTYWTFVTAVWLVLFSILYIV